MDLDINETDKFMTIKVCDFKEERKKTVENFYNDCINALVDEDISVNGLQDGSMLYLRRNNVYDCAFVTNSIFYNALHELHKKGWIKIYPDHECANEIIAEWFNND